jgi:hypothetical protein
MHSRMPATRRSLEWLAEQQDDVVTRHQLREHGYPESAVRACIRVRRWQAFGHRVVVLHNGPLTTRQRWWVALLSQHRGALAGITAATEHGLTGFDDGSIHLLVEFGARRHQLPGSRIHVSRRFSAADLHPAHTIPTVRIERALVDAASWMPAERTACAVLAAGVQQRLTTADRLRPELAAADRARHHRLLTHVLGDIEGGAESFAEIDLARFARRAGLPPPRRQVFRYDRAGRRRWLDADFDGFCVEVDGALHLRPLRYWDDMERQNDLLIVTGKPMLRFSTVAFRIAPTIVTAQLAAAAARFGSGGVR